MSIHIIQDAEAYNPTVARWIIACVQDRLRNQDRFTLVLSGGNTPKALYALLASSPYREQIPWEKIHIFWGDERAVPFSDDRNNAKMAFDSLLRHVPIPTSQIHVMRTDISPEESAKQYADILHGYFPMADDPGKNQHSFDLVLLGMGEDGHTLSLFPGTNIVNEGKKWVSAYFVPAQDMYRITLTKAVVNEAAQVAFLTTGPNKAHALREVIQGSFRPQIYPAQVIRPVSGSLDWFVDAPAAAALS